MTSAWVAGSVRARALARRRLGSDAARRLAGSASLAQALKVLADTPYGRDVRQGQTLAEAQHAVASTLLWHLRVLAGWLPRDGVAMARTLAGWFEIANTDELVYALAGGQAESPYQLGALTTAWTRLQSASSPAELGEALAFSVWGDPGGQEPRMVRLGMRISWAAQVAMLPEPAPFWATGAAALLVAGERFVTLRELPVQVSERASRLLGSASLHAATLEELGERLPAQARWILRPAVTANELWRLETRWWARVEHDGFALLGSSGFGCEPVLGTIALLAVDAWRVRAALEMAVRGGTPMEAYDAVAYNMGADDAFA